jgi:hypothetical protein
VGLQLGGRAVISRLKNLANNFRFNKNINLFFNWMVLIEFYNVSFRLDNEWMSLSDYRRKSQKKELNFGRLPNSAKLRIAESLMKRGDDKTVVQQNSLPVRRGRKFAQKSSFQQYPLPPKGLF